MYRTCKSTRSVARIEKQRVVQTHLHDSEAVGILLSIGIKVSCYCGPFCFAVQSVLLDMCGGIVFPF